MKGKKIARGAKPGAVRLGVGILNWDPSERRTNRYGTCHTRALRAGRWRCSVDRGVAKNLNGCARGSLVFVALGVPPFASSRETLSAGRRFVLNAEGKPGTLFRVVRPEGYVSVGICPDDGREDEWLDIDKLYAIHEQVGELYFETEEAT